MGHGADYGQLLRTIQAAFHSAAVTSPRARASDRDSKHAVDRDNYTLHSLLARSELQILNGSRARVRALAHVPPKPSCDLVRRRVGAQPAPSPPGPVQL